jgi:SMP-30/Gluconolactonase/LRE-like region
MKQFFTSIVCLTFLIGANAQTLTSTESVEYDPINGRFLASNGSSIIHVDGDGNEVAFMGSADAEYGMEVMNGLLYAIVGNTIFGYDLTSGDVVNSVTISGAAFLNGMASDGVDRLWVTDFSAKKIYEINCSNIANPTSTLIVTNTVTTPNGICFDGANSRLVFVNWGSSAKIKAVSLPDYTVTTIVDNAGVGNIDGIDHDNEGNFYTASWTPNRITKWSSEFTIDEIITVSGLSSPADICYSQFWKFNHQIRWIRWGLGARKCCWRRLFCLLSQSNDREQYCFIRVKGVSSCTFAVVGYDRQDYFLSS